MHACIEDHPPASIISFFKIDANSSMTMRNNKTYH